MLSSRRRAVTLAHARCPQCSAECSPCARHGPEESLKELRRRGVNAQPGAIQEEVVDLIRDDDLFDVHVPFCPEALRELDGFIDAAVAVVVSMDEQHG